MEVTTVPEPWKPKWAGDHITATYTALVRSNETAEVDEPQHIYCMCGACGGVLSRDCDTGNARNWIQKFCLVHQRCTDLKVKP